MSTEVNPPDVHEKLAARAEALFRQQHRELCVHTDRMFAGLMIFQWLVCLITAIWISPEAWAGSTSAIHPHVWAALFLGAAVSSFPVFLALTRPGAILTRHVMAVGQMFMSALLIHLSGGRIEAHFHVFGSLAFLAFYRDPRVLATATVMVLADHLLRGIYWPQSVFGVLSAPVWRAFEHAGWVAFEDFFLVVNVRRSQREMRRNAEQHAQLEATNEVIELTVKTRTAELVKTQQRLAGELAKAAVYVNSLLPAPLAGRLESEWCFHPSEQLGGDAFGHHWLDEDHLAVYLLDVCGHGVGAALLSVSVLNTLRAQSLPRTDFHDPASVLGALNRAFPAERQNFFYFTFWYGVYSVSRRELRYSSGGHPPAVLLDRGRVIPLATEGASIGCFDTARYVNAKQSVAPGARLLIFSDGVFEIFLERDRVQTLGEFLTSFDRPDVTALCPADRLKHAQQLSGDAGLEDDFSLLEIRFS